MKHGVVGRAEALGESLAIIDEFVNPHNPSNLGMNNFEREEFIARINGMSHDELVLIADIIPIDLCFDRIRKEIEKTKIFEKSIKEAMAILG